MTSLALTLARMGVIAGVALLALFLLFSLSARPATAGSQFIGDVEGLEFCTQSICGSAFFLGLFDGQVTEVPDTDGVWQLSVRHEELPGSQQSAAITGGDWRIRVSWQTQFQGEVGSGILHNNGDETFAVKAELLPESGEKAVWFFGLLDHTGVPPSVPAGSWRRRRLLRAAMSPRRRPQDRWLQRRPGCRKPASHRRARSPVRRRHPWPREPCPDGQSGRAHHAFGRPSPCER